MIYHETECCQEYITSKLKFTGKIYFAMKYGKPEKKNIYVNHYNGNVYRKFLY